ncbi:MAG: alpha/beta hydrolase [Cyclobacteriaceae bacterium]|nr:alpha/beta hydrolase [Cyclobacteriaceae bacterium HetDA_MAG_MS6]
MSEQVTYRRPWYLFNGHLESIVPYWTYKIYEVEYERERLELDDGDFLDLDWVRTSSDQLIVISHAFEGNTRDYFVERAAKYFSVRGYDILMWHYRSCSRELNRLPRFYHIGDTEDLHLVVNHGLDSGAYKSVFLLGYSLGGATTLNYLGSKLVSSEIKAGAVFSVPLDLEETSAILEAGFSKVYANSFLKKWKRKIARKAEQYPDLFDLTMLKKCTTLDQLHGQYTIALHGFDSMQEYFDQNSSLSFLKRINTPLLLVNAKNDPLLGPASFPNITSSWVQTKYPDYGGHLGFSIHKYPHSWMELETEHFFDQY